MKSARSCRLFALFLLPLGAHGLHAATYLPLQDAQLAQQAPVIVHARVLDHVVRLELVDGVEHPFTITTLATIEALKGSVPDVFEIRLAGGVVGDIAWVLPGVPGFSVGGQVILFLSQRGEAGERVFSLTELGLSKFDLVEDRAGRQFAVRPVFSPEFDDYLSGRSSGASRSGAGTTGGLRDVASFLCALRAAAGGQEEQTITYAAPEGALRSPGGASPLWVNIVGVEPGYCGGTPCLI